MTELVKKDAANDVTDLLVRYSFDLEGGSCDRLIETWLSRYPAHWLRIAVVEALYQGRYKAVSVEQILNLWQRRESPIYHFNREFERIICGRFHKSILIHPEPQPQAAASICSEVGTGSPNSADADPTDAETQSFLSSETVNPSRSQDGHAPGSHVDGYVPITNTVRRSDAHSEPSANPGCLPEKQRFEFNSVDNSESGELPIQTFKPTTHSNDELELWEGLSKSRNAAGKYPIHQFIPTPAPSDFHSKLKAVVQGIASSEDNSTKVAADMPERQSNFYTRLRAVAQTLLPVEPSSVNVASHPRAYHPLTSNTSPSNDYSSHDSPYDSAIEQHPHNQADHSSSS